MNAKRIFSILSTFCIVAPLAGCAFGLDFDEFDNSCDEPDFDFANSSVFCGGTWGDSASAPISTPVSSLDPPINVSSAVTQFENIVAVATMSIVTADDVDVALRDACPSYYVITATMLQRGAGTLVPQAHGSSITLPIPISEGPCDHLSNDWLPAPLDIEIVGGPQDRRVAIAAGSLGLFTMELVDIAADPATAALNIIPASFLNGAARPTDCDAGACTGVGDACVLHSDCDAGSVCCQGTCSDLPLVDCANNRCPQGTTANAELGCEVQCSQDVHCPGHMHCEPGDGQPGLCVAQCEVNSDCVGMAGLVCQGGECLTPCPAGRGCQPGTEICLDDLCVPNPECNGPGQCGLGAVGEQDGAVLDIALSGNTMFVAMGLGGLVRIDLQTQERFHFELAPFAIDIDANENRIWLVDQRSGLSVFNLSTLANGDSRTPDPIASAPVSDGLIQDGIALAARGGRVFVLSGGFFNQIQDASPQYDIAEFQFTGSIINQISTAPAGSAPFPGVSWIHQTTDGLTSAIAIGSSSAQTDGAGLVDAPLQVRILDASNPGQLNTNAPISSRTFNQQTQGELSVWRGFSAEPGAIIVADGENVESFNFFIRSN